MFYTVILTHFDNLYFLLRFRCILFNFKIFEEFLGIFLLFLVSSFCGLNTHYKLEIVKWDKKKQETTICCLWETRFMYKPIEQLRVKIWRKLYSSCTNRMKAGVVLLISDKVEIRTRNTIMDNKKHYTMIKWPFIQGDIT